MKLQIEYFSFKFQLEVPDFSTELIAKNFLLYFLDNLRVISQ